MSSDTTTIYGRRNNDQKRAKMAWDSVNAVASNKKIKSSEYLSLVRKSPAMIQTNGLGQMLAFLNAKGEIQKNKRLRNDADGPHFALYKQLEEWLQGNIGIGEDFIEWLVKQDSVSYRMATNETLAYLQWLKRFAEASLKDDKGNNGGKGNEAGGDG